MTGGPRAAAPGPLALSAVENTEAPGALSDAAASEAASAAAAPVVPTAATLLAIVVKKLPCRIEPGSVTGALAESFPAKT